MTTSEYQNLTPREATPGSASVLFSFARIRENTTTRFYPGDGAKLHFANRDVDTLEIPGVPAGYLAAGDVVTATYKGVTVFRGDVATIVESKNRGTDATQTVTCVGPWSKMQRLVYRQPWYVGNGNSYSSRLVLNQTVSGSAQTLNSALAEIADLGASACGYVRGTVNVSAQILPTDECRDITVADAIKRELRLFPKAVCRFDYSTQPPKLNIVKNSAATTAAYVASIPKSARACVYNSHPISGVDLEIEATGTIEGVEYRQISHQTAGNTSAGNPDCLYATLQIRGTSASSTRQSFTSVTEDIPSDLNDVSWWKARHPRLANVASSAITITEGARTPSNCQRISAATAGELEEAGLHCEVSKFTCKATIATTDDKEENVYLTLNFLTTNAEGTAADPKTYTWTTSNSSESGEYVPDGLAATILAERAGTLLSERLSIRLGDALPTLGDAIVESGGTVFLQSFDVDCGSLTADLEFGVPDYLAPEDMASLLSNFRNKRTTSSSSIRKTGKTADGGSKVEMGAIPPLSSSEFAPGTKSKTTFKSSSGGGSIKLDSSELTVGENISVREVTVKGDDGTDKTVKVLASDAFSVKKGTDSDSEDKNTGVSSLNGSTGAISIIGGNCISVSTSGQTITISYEEGKEADEDPNAKDESSCGHPGSNGSGGGGGGGGGGTQGTMDGEEQKTDCCGDSSGTSPGVSSAADGRGAQAGTVVATDDSGDTTTTTSHQGIQKLDGEDSSGKGRLVPASGIGLGGETDTTGRALGDGDVRQGTESTSDGSSGQVGKTDIHGFAED